MVLDKNMRIRVKNWYAPAGYRSKYLAGYPGRRKSCADSRFLDITMPNFMYKMYGCTNLWERDKLLSRDGEELKVGTMRHYVAHKLLDVVSLARHLQRIKWCHYYHVFFVYSMHFLWKVLGMKCMWCMSKKFWLILLTYYISWLWNVLSTVLNNPLLLFHEH